MLKQAKQRRAAALKVWAEEENVAPAIVCWVTNVCSDVRGVIDSLGAVPPLPVWLNVKLDCTVS